MLSTNPAAKPISGAYPTTTAVVRPGCYRYDPYSASGRIRVGPNTRLGRAAGEEHGAPAGTCHVALWGRVGFVPYPQEPFEPRSAPAVGPEDHGEPVRVFIGQLPYFVTEMQLGWLCHTFGAGHAVEAPERIMKRQASTGGRLPTGCVHAYTSARGVEAMARGMHKRMLVDDTGVWHARTVAEFDVLSAYVGAMKQDRTLRVPNRPYDTVVVQEATSSFNPIKPLPLDAPVPSPSPRHVRHSRRGRAQVRRSKSRAAAAPPSDFDPSFFGPYP